MTEERPEKSVPEWWTRRCAQLADGPHFDGPKKYLEWWHGFPLNTSLRDACGNRYVGTDFPELFGNDERDWVNLWGDCGVQFRSRVLQRLSVRIDGEDVDAHDALMAALEGQLDSDEISKGLYEPIGVEHRCTFKYPPHIWLRAILSKKEDDFRANVALARFGPDRVYEWYLTNRAPNTFFLPLQHLKKERSKYFRGDERNLSLWHRKAGESSCQSLVKHARLSGEQIDFANRFCSALGQFMRHGGCPSEVIDYFVKEIEARLWDVWLRRHDAADFPTKAPRIWPQDKRPGENIRMFIEATYGEYIARGMNRVQVRNLDRKAVKALEIWAAQQNKKGKSVDINAILPRRSQKVDDVLEQFAAAGKPITEKDWRVRGVETPEARLRVRARRSAYRRAWGQRRKTGKAEPR